MKKESIKDSMWPEFDELMTESHATTRIFASARFDYDRFKRLNTALRNNYKVIDKYDAIDIMHAFGVCAEEYCEYDVYSVCKETNGRLYLKLEKLKDKSRLDVWLIDNEARKWLNEARVYDLWPLLFLCCNAVPANVVKAMSNLNCSAFNTKCSASIAPFGKYAGVSWDKVIDDDFNYAAWVAYNLHPYHSYYVINRVYNKLVKKYQYVTA